MKLKTFKIKETCIEALKNRLTDELRLKAIIKQMNVRQN